jgi:hypothetical protein
MNGLQRIIFVCLAAIGAMLAGCGGGGVSTTAIPTSGSTSTPSATSVYAIPIASETELPVAGAGTPQPLPSTGTDFASLASMLVAAQPVAATAAGTLGTIVSISGRTLTLQQTTAITNDSTGAAPDFEQSYTSVGTAGGTVTVTVAPNATVATRDGFADLTAGQQIIAGGTASGSNLTASFIMVVADATTASTALAARSATAATRATQAVSPPPGWTSTSGTLSASGGLPGGIHMAANKLVATSGKYSCFIGGPATASATLNVTSDLAIALPQVTIGFPYRIDYDATPAPYMNTGSGYQSPGAMNTWMQFNALPGPTTGTTSTPTYDVAFRFDASFNLVVMEPCTGLNFTVFGVTAGYGYESSTAQAYPSASQTVTLAPVKCIDVNIPIHFTFPVPGVGGINPFGSSQAGLDVCGVPMIQGGVVSATPSNVMQASLSGGQVVFDPSQTGAASVSTAPLLNPTGPSASFTLNPTAPVTYTDAETLEYSLYGVCIVGIPSCASQNTGGAPLFPSFTRQLTSTPQTIQLQAPSYATCVITDPIQVDNNAPPSTSCDSQMYIANGDQPATITISNLPSGTYSWSPSAQGLGTTDYGPPCTGSSFAPYYTVTPASATGTSVTFSFSATGATGNAQLQCAGTFVNQSGQPILSAPNIPVLGDLLVNEYPANPNAKARRSK